jgi:hypothetical protein
LVAEDDVFTFLLQNNMPVVSSLLPPKTGKILFIAFSRVELREKEENFEHICTTKLAVDNGLLSIPADLIVSETLPDNQLTRRLSLLFTS